MTGNLNESADELARRRCSGSSVRLQISPIISRHLASQDEASAMQAWTRCLADLGEPTLVAPASGVSCRSRIDGRSRSATS